MYYDLPWSQNNAFSMRRLSRLYPNDVRVQAQIPLNNEPLEDSEDEAAPISVAIPLSNGMPSGARQNIAEFDRLIDRFPNETWLLAKRLEYALRNFHHNRLSGEYDRGYRNSRAVRGKPASEKSPVAANFSRDDWQRAMKLAQRGAVAEPDNAYWDWVQAWLWYADHQDSACFAALKRAGQRAKFDSHWYDDVRAKIGAHELARPLLFEEKSRLVQQDGQGMGPFESLGHNILWQARKRERSSDAQGGLQLRGDLARACALMMRGRHTFFIGERAGEMQRVAWRLTPVRMRDPYQTNEGTVNGDAGKASLQMAQRFAVHARRLGRADLADETLKLGQARADFHRLKRRHRDHANLHLAPSTSAWMTGLFGMGIANLWQITALPGLWIVLSLVMLRSRGEERPGSARKVLWLVIATALMVGSLAAWLVTSAPSLFGFSPRDPVAADRGVIGMICAVVFFLTPALFGALCSWAWAVQHVWHERKVLLVPEPPRYDGESAKLLVANPWPWMVTFVTWTIIVVALLGWLGALLAWRTGATVWNVPLAPIFEPNRKDIWLPIREPLAICCATACVLSIFCWVAWPFKWRFNPSERLRPIAHAALQHYRFVLGRWMLIASCFWLAFSLLSLPSRRAADRHLEQLLSRGEIALLASP